MNANLLDATTPTMATLAGAAALLAQATLDLGGIGTALVQFGGIGAVLAWITLVDIPARNKMLSERDNIWREQVAAERAAAKERLESERAHATSAQAALVKAFQEVAARQSSAQAELVAAFKDALERNSSSVSALSGGLAALAGELKERRAT